MKKEWQDVKTLVEAASVEANAHNKTAFELLLGYDDNNAGSSGSAEASTITEFHNQERLLDNLAKEQVRAYVKLLP
ncbi:MAG: hypothetical protein ACKPKO_24370, partial [Candidatus Fonsibacter sp.]